MQFLPKTLALALVSLWISAASAKTLTDKQAKDAAARIDQLLGVDLKAANLKQNDRVDEGTFVRRAYLGVIGRIPTEEEANAFFDDTSQEKRAELIDKLVVSPGFDSHLFNWTADLLRVQTKQEQFGLGWHVWLRKSLAEDKPWDVLVREMLGATGHAAKNPAVGYYLRDRNMQLDNFSNTMQVFLGRQIGCAQCHDHPFDDWSQYEYYQMAAFGGGFTYRSKDAQDTVRRVAMDMKPDAPEVVRNKKGKVAKKRNDGGNAAKGIQKTLNPLFKDFNKNAIFDDSSKSLELPADYQYRNAEPKATVPAETLFGEHLENIAPAERREAFSKWVTSPENPFFTKVIANRLWARTFGHGLQDPVDDWSEDSKPSHPEVLAFLEQTMKAVDYDLRQFSRVLYHTNLFQRECETVEPESGVPHLFSGPTLQRMSAEQLFDSMIVLTQGEISDAPVTSHAYKWESYTEAIDKLLKADSKDLLVLGESATQAEAAFRDAQSEVRRLQRELSEAKSGPERIAAQKAFQAARRKQGDLRDQRDPISMMGASMEMEGNRKERRGGDTARTSEKPAPFNPGTLVSEFGGSDRMTASSSSTEATVPQALALLNDPNTDIIAGKRSFLGNRLLSMKSPEERLKLVFLTLYSRQPTADEIKRFTPMANDANSMKQLTRAMLTSNQFIFVQ